MESRLSQHVYDAGSWGKGLLIRSSSRPDYTSKCMLRSFGATQSTSLTLQAVAPLKMARFNSYVAGAGVLLCDNSVV